MTSFNRTLLYTFVVFLSVFYRLINSQVDTTLSLSTPAVTSDEFTSSTSTPMVTNSTMVSPTTPLPNNSTTTTSVSSSISISISTDPSTTSAIDDVRPPDGPSGPGWWLLVALLITIVIVIIAGIIFYHRQRSPYRRSISCLQWCRQCNFRFLQNWRSRDDDTDNIILQLEQPEPTNGQWPPRISFT